MKALEALLVREMNHRDDGGGGGGAGERNSLALLLIIMKDENTLNPKCLIRVNKKS